MDKKKLLLLIGLMVSSSVAGIYVGDLIMAALARKSNRNLEERLKELKVLQKEMENPDHTLEEKIDFWTIVVDEYF